MLGVVLGIAHPTKNRQFLPSCFHSSIMRTMHICKGGVGGMCQVGRLRGTPALGRRLWEPRPTALGQEALTLGLLGQETPPPAVFSGLRVRAGQVTSPGGRDRTPAHLRPWSLAQSWHAWVCVYFCSPERPEQEPAFVDSSVVSEGFPGDASGKGPTCQCRRHRRCGFDPWVSKMPWRRKWQPSPVFLPGESQRQRSLASLDTTKVT